MKGFLGTVHIITELQVSFLRENKTLKSIIDPVQNKGILVEFSARIGPYNLEARSSDWLIDRFRSQGISQMHLAML
jgi:hypothetical protein